MIMKKSVLPILFFLLAIAVNGQQTIKTKDQGSSALLPARIIPPPGDGGGETYSWYLDWDADGYGNADLKVESSTKPTGYVNNSRDCNDHNAAINPRTLWYRDTDGDGLGDPASSTRNCTHPQGYVPNNDDQCPNEAGPDNGCPSPEPEPNPSLNTFSNENYVFTRIYQIPLSSPVGINSPEDVIEEITYYDGLGRPMQHIGIKQAGGTGYEDIITHIGYDTFGRKDKSYLPYPQAAGDAGSYRTGDIVGNTKSYYNNLYPQDFSSTIINPYSEIHFEDSPLNRVKEQGAPGVDWSVNKASDNDHTIKYNYATNTTSEVRVYGVSLSADYVPTLVNPNNAFYESGQLFKVIVKDENWKPEQTHEKDHTSETFKDKQGRLVLKRAYNNGLPHDTYYVYDDYGNLSYVLPPKAEATSGIPTSAEQSGLCYQYRYDHRNRLIEKKIPGKGWEYIVYDELDQPILTQDANLRQDGKWRYTKYDAFGRIIMTGMYTSSSDRAAMQTTVNNYYKNTPSARAWEEKINSSTYNYYTNNSFPTSTANSEILALNYYDNYTFNIPSGLKLADNTLIFDNNVDYNVKSLLSGSKVKVIGQNTWITTVNHYDKKGRMIYTASFNDFLNTTDKIRYDLGFTGIVEKTQTYHKKSGKAAITVTDDFFYDHVNRLIKHTQTIGNHTELIAKNTYSKTGKLMKKAVGNTAVNPLQEVDYAYNVRGWLKKINDPNSLGTDLFSFNIRYNDPTTVGTPLYNGNISQTRWRTNNIDNSMKAYTYSYDDLNRITKGIFTVNAYSLIGVIYDKNGNIKSLRRRGAINAAATSFGNMDVLSYAYNSSSNRLSKVNDSGNDTYGFKDGSSATTQYTYDANGNMISDANKGITSISYNYLNMPTEIKFNGSNSQKINYIYSAGGIKQRKVTNDNGNITTTDYAGDFVYTNGTLKQFYHPEGYVEPSGSSFKYVYRYKDIWGSTRITYADDNNNGSVTSGEIRREQNYYPFGLEHKGYNGSTYGVKNNLMTYQGQEFTEDLDLNTHEWKYRMSDPAIGRFWQIDPLAEKYAYNSTYAFQENKLGMGTELEGRELDPWSVSTSARSPEVRQYVQENPKTSTAIAGAYVAGPGIMLAVESYGIVAVGSFLLNEAKDEVLSVVTSGASDVLDITKAGTKFLKEGFQFLTRNIDSSGDLFHYTSKEAADNIKFKGFDTDYTSDGNIYTTPVEGLSPTQAQIELALPANRPSPNTMIRIDGAGLKEAGISPIIGPRRVQGNLPGLGNGGGTEVLFNQSIPPRLIKEINSINN